MKTSKLPVDPNWFKLLLSPYARDDWEWLSKLRTSVESLASFGCMSSEPFILMWHLDASEVKVVEIKEEYIQHREAEKEIINRLEPAAFKGRTIKFIREDMLRVGEDELLSNHFDLAFCKSVLYQILRADLEESQEITDLQTIRKALWQVSKAIGQMARITKPGGRVIAIESIALSLGDEPIPIDLLFEGAGLTQDQLANAPEDAYCHRKPKSGTLQGLDKKKGYIDGLPSRQGNLD